MTTLHSLEQLELTLKVMTFKPKDIIVIRIGEGIPLNAWGKTQEDIARLVGGLELDFPLYFIVIPPTMDLQQLDEATLNEAGWERSKVIDGEVLRV